MEENKKETVSMIECENCKAKIAGTAINHKKEFKVNGQSIFLTYFDCHCCGKRHFVQIDDATSLSELKFVTNQFFKLVKRRKDGKSVSKKQSENFKNSRQHLSDYRIKLMKEFTGKSVTDITGIEYVLRFNI